jgi:hypothetical protein
VDGGYDGGGYLTIIDGVKYVINKRFIGEKKKRTTKENEYIKVRVRTSGRRRLINNDHPCIFI